jgi:hypothetical protein
VGGMRLNALLLTLLLSAVAQAAEPGQREGQAYADPGAPAAAAASAATLPGEQIAKQIAEKLGVQVLGVAPTDAKDPPTYAVRVMNPAGNDNGAFVVSTLLVDASSGAILGEAHPVPSAARPDAMSLTRTPEDADGGRDLRRRTFR